ncbi:MAG TPA: ribosome maturation factor RimM [Candidatus Acidoferrales bacterium]|nr:ribosome maturation factor RimM [Candidatus Acidoferrales bacterium]
MATQQPPEAAGVTVARVLRPHGRRGEVAAEILTDFPQRLARLSSAELRNGRSEPRRVAIRSCWLSRSRGGQAIFHFAGSDSISDAEKLTGFDVQIPFSERMPLPFGSYYITDLIGCQVRQTGGAAVGRVRDVQSTGEEVAGTPLLVVDSPDGELLIPLAQEICVEVDTAAQSIEVALPEGLRDLNRNS